MAGLHDIKKKDWERLLKKNGFRLDRSGKHEVWKHADGRTISVSSTGINPCIARRVVKEYHLEGAPFGWSELAKKTDDKEESRNLRQLAADDANRSVLESAKQAILTTKETAANVEQKEQLAPEHEKISSAIISNTTLYMNEKRLERFHEYLCAVVEYYHKNGKILKNFSFLAKQFQVKGITQEVFKNYKLGDLKPGEKPSRKLSDSIRLSMSEKADAERKKMLDAYLKEQAEREAAAENQPEEPHEPTLAERIDTFEARFDLLGPVFADISSRLTEYYTQQFGSDADNLLGQDSWNVRLSPEPYLNEWANNVEFDLTRLVFDQAEPEEVRQLLPTWSDKILHAYLTWLYGGKDGRQLKLNFDERGCAESQNEALIDLLNDQGLLEQILFVKLESWKGTAHCAAVYKDAPDVLMIINDSGAEFYTVSDDIWYSNCGETIICPESSFGFGGWGTRTIVGFCLRHLLSEDNHKEALKEQEHVTKLMRGKLMDDISHYRDIWQMYHDEFVKQQRKSMIEFV